MCHPKRIVLHLAVALIVTLVPLACGSPTAPASPTGGIATSTAPIPTATPIEPTPSAEPSATPTRLLAATESEPTPTVEPLATPTLPPTAAGAPPSTPVPTPPSPTVPATPACTVLPEGVFLTIWKRDPARQAALGCPMSNHPRVEPAAWEVETAYQPFEQGAMIWSNRFGWHDVPIVYVLYDDGTFQAAEDTFDPSTDPGSGGETPPTRLFEPTLGFGKVWREEPGVRAGLGWATAEETPGAGRFGFFAGGNMIWLSQRGQTLVFLSADSTYALEMSPTFE
jgi:hypothetical protein